MFNSPTGLWPFVMNNSQPRGARVLRGAISAMGFLSTVLPPASWAEAQSPALDPSPLPIHGVGRMEPGPMELLGAHVRQDLDRAIANLRVAQLPPEEPEGLEEEGETGEPPLVDMEEAAPDGALPNGSTGDPRREQTIPEEAPSGAVQGITPEQQVLIAEVVIVGLEDHPDRERLEAIAYNAMEVEPGKSTTRSELERDLTAIYATGWFSDVRVTPSDGPLGVRLEVAVTPNPILSAVELQEQDVLLPAQVLQETFAEDQGKTINLLALQRRLTRLEEWYAEQGYSLARVLGPTRITPEGVVVLTVREGTVEDIVIEFVDDSGETTDADGEPIPSGTKLWVITREVSTKAGDRFNRRTLQRDLERLYGTGLFSDINISLEPIPADPGSVAVVFKVQEAKTGSLSGGLGYSDSQGIFGQASFSEENLFGRAWRTDIKFTYGQYGVLLDLAFQDPWIRNDPYRTSFRMNVLLSQEIPLQFQSEDGPDISVVEDYWEAPASTMNRVYSVSDINNPGSIFENGVRRNLDPQMDNLFSTDGDQVRLRRNGLNFQFIRPLNKGNPYADDTRWTASAGMSFQRITTQNSHNEAKAWAKGPPQSDETTDNFFCIGYDCKAENTLVGGRLGLLYNTLDSRTNPSSGNFASLSTEQYISFGEGSPTFNRSQFSLAHFIPMRLLNIYSGCRPQAGEAEECPQTLAFQVTGGTLLGEAPVYESFCLGGATSLRGFSECAIGPGTTFAEATVEYRFPILRIVSGELFVEAGSMLGSQSNVKGNPGALLNKPESGTSYGAGVVITTPLGPLRVEAAKGDPDWRFNFAVGWKF